MLIQRKINNVCIYVLWAYCIYDQVNWISAEESTADELPADDTNEFGKINLSFMIWILSELNGQDPLRSKLTRIKTSKLSVIL